MDGTNEDTLAATYAACDCGTITEDHSWSCASNPTGLPSRRVFVIDVGDMEPGAAEEYIRKVKEAMATPRKEPFEIDISEDELRKVYEAALAAEIPEQSCCQCGHSLLDHVRSEADSVPLCSFGCVSCSIGRGN
jgi:hypothetical protein